MKTALFSLNMLDKVEDFAISLTNLGWRIIASQETYDILTRKGLPVINISEFTGIEESYGFPPTLHPRIEACLTVSEEDRIHLVYVIPYPLSEGNDIGGRTLLALAAKGNRIPIMSVSDMELVISELEKYGEISKDLHQALIDKTNALISSHYDDLVRDRNLYDLIFGSFKYRLKSGENPYQIPAGVFNIKKYDALSIANFEQVSGDLPCFTNLADSDSLIYTMCLVCEAFKLIYKKIPYVCIAGKHGNACGMGISWNDQSEAVNKALFGNPRAIWGGEVIVNFSIDETLANLLFKSKERQIILGDTAWMLDVIVAPGFSKQAVRTLGQRKNRKLLENKALLSPFLSSVDYIYRFIRGGFLRQPPNNFVLDFTNVKMIGLKLDEYTIELLIIAWAVAWSSNHGGNEIAIVKGSQLLAVGGGPSTVEAALVAVTRAKNCGHNLEGSVFAANAFFPFTDAPQLLIDIHPKAGLVPSGGKLLGQIQDLFFQKGVAMVYLPEQYRGFSRH